MSWRSVGVLGWSSGSLLSWSFEVVVASLTFSLRTCSINSWQDRKHSCNKFRPRIQYISWEHSFFRRTHAYRMSRRGVGRRSEWMKGKCSHYRKWTRRRLWKSETKTLTGPDAPNTFTFHFLWCTKMERWGKLATGICGKWRWCIVKFD